MARRTRACALGITGRSNALLAVATLSHDVIADSPQVIPNLRISCASRLRPETAGVYQRLTLALSGWAERSQARGRRKMNGALAARGSGACPRPLERVVRPPAKLSRLNSAKGSHAPFPQTFARHIP